MTTQEMLTQLEERTGKTDVDVLTSYLNDATRAILNHVYPFSDITVLPERYQRRQLEIAVYLVNKRGADGETKHDENGVNRTYESGNIPDSFFEGLVPFAKVLAEDGNANT